MIFKPARKVKIFQDVVHQIQEAVLSGSLKPGHSLPSEKKLEAIFQTSRPTIRKAIKEMEDRGLIKLNPGRSGGMVVNAFFKYVC